MQEKQPLEKEENALRLEREMSLPLIFRYSPPELAPYAYKLMHRLPGFIGPIPPPLLIRLFNCHTYYNSMIDVVKCLFLPLSPGFCLFSGTGCHFALILHFLLTTDSEFCIIVELTYIISFGDISWQALSSSRVPAP